MLDLAAQTRTALAGVIVDSLKHNIRDGSYAAAARLPTESNLCQRFGMSRPSVRAAAKELNVLRLVSTRHGVGTFVTDQPSVLDGLERMGSITDSIRASG